MSGLFNTDQPIFKDRDELDINNHDPENFIKRSPQTGKYAKALEPALQGWKPNNVFIYGKAGTGKTATTHFVLDELDEEMGDIDDDVNLDVLFLNCDGQTSSYQVAIKLLNDQLRDDDNQVSTKGHSPSKIYGWLFEELDKLGGVNLIVLDEIDHIGDDSILYQFARAEAIDNVENCKVGLVGISNDFDYRSKLSAKVKDSLCEKEIEFNAYDANELQKILKVRAENALYDDAYNEGEIIGLCAALGADTKGNARRAMDILRTAGDIATAQGAEEITKAHVYEAKEEVIRGRVADKVSGLSPHEKHVTHALTFAELEGITPVKTKDLYREYCHICEEEFGKESQSIRAVRDHLSELEMLGLATVEEKNLGKGGGKFKQVTLVPDANRVNEAFAMERPDGSTDSGYQTTL